MNAPLRPVRLPVDHQLNRYLSARHDEATRSFNLMSTGNFLPREGSQRYRTTPILETPELNRRLSLGILTIPFAPMAHTRDGRFLRELVEGWRGGVPLLYVEDDINPLGEYLFPEQVAQDAPQIYEKFSVSATLYIGNSQIIISPASANEMSAEDYRRYGHEANLRVDLEGDLLPPFAEDPSVGSFHLYTALGEAPLTEANPPLLAQGTTTYSSRHGSHYWLNVQGWDLPKVN